jgi:DNA-binding SARP family transcriptional activator/tetratricopeptide (TPR) repeat protein
VGSRTETVRRSGFSVELRLFGTPEARLEGEPVGLSAQKYHLLGVLVICGDGGIRTADLLGLLWAEGTESERRARLRQALYQIRSTLDCASEIVRSCRQDRLVLDGSAVTTDLDGFRRLLEERRAGEAVALLESGFLAGARQGMTDALATWIRDEERGLRAEARAAATCLWTSSTRRADWRAAEEAARALITLDPMEQANLRRLMRVLAISGQVDQAQAEEASFVERARSIDPEWTLDPRTRALKEGLPGLARERVERVHFRRLPGLADPPLLGREREMAALEALLQHPPEGRAQFIVISGESGVGKTRLAQEAVAIASPPGSRVLSARCRERQRELPLTPLITAVTRGEVEEEIQRLPSLWREVLLEVAPELRPSAEPDQGGRLVQPSQLRRLQAEGFHRLLQELAATGPVILFLDDLHWADADTLLVLDHLRSRWSAGSLSVVATVGGGGGLSPPFRTHGLSERAHIEVGTLSLSDALRLWDEFWALSSDDSEGPELPPLKLRRAIIWFLEGNPGRVLKVASELRALEGLPSPESYEESVFECIGSLVEGRLALLSKPALNLIQGLACLRRSVSLADLSRFAGLPPERIESHVDQLMELRLVRFVEGRIRISHRSILKAMRCTTPPSTKLRWHSQLADALARTASKHVHADRVFHLFMSGRGEEAVHPTLQLVAGTPPQDRIPSLVRLLRMTLRENLDPRTDAHVRVRLAEFLLLLGAVRQAQDALAPVLTDGHAVGDSSLAFRARLTAAEARALQSGYVGTEPTNEISRLIGELLESHAWEHVPRALELELRIRSRRGDYDGVRRRLDRLPGIIAQAPPEVASRVGSMRFLSSLFAEATASEAEFSNSLSDLESTKDVVARLQALNGLLILGIQLGKLNSDNGVRLREKVAASLRTEDHPELRVKLASNLALWFLESCDFAAAKSAFAHAKALMERYPIPAASTTLLVNLGELELAQRHYEAAEDLFDEALEGSPSHPSEPGHLLATAGLALAHLGQGRLARASECIDRLQPISPWYPFDHDLLARAESKVLLARGKRALAAERLQEAALSLRGRFNMGWARLEIECLRITQECQPSADQLRAFLDQNELRHLKSRFNVCQSKIA